MATKHLTVSLKRDWAISASLEAKAEEKLVYVLVADKKIKYNKGRSRIAYIGTTENGASRMAQSVAYRADTILSLHGVRRFDARVVTSKPRQRVKTWKKLERGLLLRFKKLFGEVPFCNSHGKNIVTTNEFELFRQERLDRIIENLS